MICLLQFLFIKRSKNFFCIKVFYYICPQSSICNSFNEKTFVELIWCVTFCRNVFILRCFYMVTSFKFRFVTNVFYTEVNICIQQASFWLCYDMYCCIHLIYLKYLFFDIEVIYIFKILFLNVLINLSAAAYFPSLCVEYISVSLSNNHDFIDLLQISLPLSAHILISLRLDSFKIFWKRW